MSFFEKYFSVFDGGPSSYGSSWNRRALLLAKSICQNNYILHNHSWKTLPLFIVVPEPLLIFVPCPCLVTDCVQLVIAVPDPRSLIAPDSGPVPVPVSLRPRSDGLEQFISVIGSRSGSAGGH